MGRIKGLALVGGFGLIFCGQSFGNARVDVERGVISGDLSFPKSTGGGEVGGGGGSSKKGTEPSGGTEQMGKWTFFKCGEGACAKEAQPKASPASPPNTGSTPEKSEMQKYAEFWAKVKEDAKKLRIEKKIENADKPLETSNQVVKEILKVIIEYFPGGEVLVSIFDTFDSPETVGVSLFDKKYDDYQLLVIREALDQEQKEQLEEIKKEKETNKKIFEENLKQLQLDGKYEESKPSEEIIIRGPASELSPATQQVMSTIRSLSTLKGKNFAAITDHVLRRGVQGSLIPISPKLSKQIVKAMEPMTKANACVVPGGSCMLFEGAKGDSCYCPKMVSQTAYVRINGVAVKNELGGHCKNGGETFPMPALYPVGLNCNIPVNVSINPYYPQFEFLRGKVSKYACKTWEEKLSEYCE